MTGRHFRKTGRRPVGLRARYWEASGLSPEHRGDLVDLGMGGAQIRSPELPPDGVLLRLRLSAPTAWDPLELRCRVRWVVQEPPEGPAFGVEFEGLTPHESQALAQLLSTTQYDDEEEA